MAISETNVVFEIFERTDVQKVRHAHRNTSYPCRSSNHEHLPALRLCVSSDYTGDTWPTM